MDRSYLTLEIVIETGGENTLSFLSPKDLFKLSTINHRYRETVAHQYIFNSCHKQLHTPIKLGVGTNYLVEFQRGPSLMKHKTKLWDCVFARLNLKEELLDILRREDGQTGVSREDALHLLRQRAEENSFIKVEGARGDILVTASCNMRDQNRDFSLGLARYILERDACRKGQGKENYSFVEDWLNFLIRLRGVSMKYWEWDIFQNCRREFAKGLVLMSSEGGKEIEIRLTRLY